jgi:hypothetical protein
MLIFFKNLLTTMKYFVLCSNECKLRGHLKFDESKTANDEIKKNAKNWIWLLLNLSLNDSISRILNQLQVHS